MSVTRDDAEKIKHALGVVFHAFETRVREDHAGEIFADMIGTIDAAKIMGIGPTAAKKRARNFPFFRGKTKIIDNGNKQHYIFLRSACEDFVKKHGQGHIGVRL